jgi:hypothetical protein
MAKRNRKSRSAKPKKAYAEGGAVDAQMEAMMSDGVDPVSGNEVPVGAMPEEVRDDIDAKLSEGEYVVPADVVRYHGVSKFEDLRDEAKLGWQEMEAEGRVGGEPVGMEMGGDDLPFDLAELNIVDDGMDDQPEMYDGGLVRGYAVGGDVTQMANPFEPYTPTEEYKTFKNDAGMTLVVRFVDGKPFGYIPPGYTEEQSTATAVSEAVTQQVSQPATTTTQREPEGPPDNGYDVGTTGAAGGDSEPGFLSDFDPGRAGRAVAGTAATMALTSAVPVLGVYESVATLANKALGTDLPTPVADLFDSIMSQDDDTTTSNIPGPPMGRPSMQALAAADPAFQGQTSTTSTTPAPPPDRPANLGNIAANNNVAVATGGTYSGVVGELNEQGYTVSADGKSVYSGTGQVAGENWSGSRTVDAIRGMDTAPVSGGYSSDLGYHEGPNQPGQGGTVAGGYATDMGYHEGPTAPEGGGGGNGDGTVICTALNKKGLLSDEIYKLDAEYGNMIERTNPAVLYGYRKIATPLANYLMEDTKGAKLTRTLVAPIANAWAKQMAHELEPEQYKPSLIGKAIMVAGYPLCSLVGNKMLKGLQNAS